MKKQLIMMIATATILLATPVNAQTQGYGYRPDPQVVRTFNEMINTTGVFCQMGRQQACNTRAALQQAARKMFQAGAQCQAGNQNSCRLYNETYRELGVAYQQLAQEVRNIQRNMPRTGYGNGTTHAQRMRNIRQRGLANTRRYQQRQRQMDLNHQRFMKTLRQ